jgi:hypothetical protein
MREEGRIGHLKKGFFPLPKLGFSGSKSAKPDHLR